MFIFNLVENLLNIQLVSKKIIILLIDINICIISFFLAIYLRIGFFEEPNLTHFIAIAVSVMIMALTFLKLNMYSIVFRFYDYSALKLTIRAVFIYSIIYFMTTLFLIELELLKGVPRTVGIIQPLVLLVLIYISRSSLSLIVGYLKVTRKNNYQFKNVIIYGAGEVGQRLANSFYINPKFNILYFFDDDINKQNRIVSGIKILKKTHFEKMLVEKKISEIWLAISNITEQEKIKIVNYIENFNIVLKILPDINDIKKESISIKNLRSLNISEILGRLEHKEINKINIDIEDKSVLIVGAGGTIGSKLCFKILEFDPKIIILLERTEFTLYKTNQELNEKIVHKSNCKTRIIPILGSINNKLLIRNIFSRWKCDLVYHAAAYKHVPIVELNVLEGLRNNIFGTLNLIDCIKEFKVKDCVLISTDKAVRPTNIMGVSKRISELILLANSEKSVDTKFSIVRFGNVIGSSGSVIPKFIDQINNLGPITLTHKKVTRFFMSVDEAVELVIQASQLAKGGETFMLDMGKPVKLYDLILKIIKLNGMKVKNKQNPNGDIEIKIIGLRPGEKLYEELLISNKMFPTEHPKINKGIEPFIEASLLYSYLDRLNTAIQNKNIIGTLSLLKEMVPEYKQPKKQHDLFLTSSR